MDKFKILIIPAFSFIGSILSSAFGGWNELIMLLVIAVILDYIFGVLVAFITGTLSSQIGWKGIAKKVLIFSLVAVAHIVDVILGDKDIVRNATILFYLSNECISIIENAARAGIPIPKALLNALEMISQKPKKYIVEEKGENDQDEQQNQKDKTE